MLLASLSSVAPNHGVPADELSKTVSTSIMYTPETNSWLAIRSVEDSPASTSFLVIV